MINKLAKTLKHFKKVRLNFIAAYSPYDYIKIFFIKIMKDERLTDGKRCYWLAFNNVPLAYYIPGEIYILLGMILPTYLSKKWIKCAPASIRFNIADYCGKGY